MRKQGFTQFDGPALVTIVTSRTTPHRLEAAVTTLNSTLDRLAADPRPDSTSAWASLGEGNTIQVEVHPGVSTLGAIMQMVTRSVPSARIFSSVPLAV